MEPVIAHIDMDCFFCACEEKRRPQLKGQPVMVGSTGDRGVVSAANYEARKKGVFSATPISTARQNCPEGTFLAVDKAYYSQESQKVMAYLVSLADVFVQFSIDEAALDVTSRARRYLDLESLARTIQETIWERFGLSASVGIASSPTVAKIASDHNKPYGITVVEDARSFLAPLPISKIPGIGKVARQQYEAEGVMTIGDLAAMDRFRVLERFGRFGITYQDIAKGIPGYLHEPGRRKSYSRERTFQYDVSNHDLLRGTLAHLSGQLEDDMAGETAQKIGIKIRYSDFTTKTRERSLRRAIHSRREIYTFAAELFGAYYEGGSVRLIGIRLSNLGGRQIVQTQLTDFVTLDEQQKF